MKHYPKFIALAIIIAIIMAIIALHGYFHSPAFRARQLRAEIYIMDEPLSEISETFMYLGFIHDVEQRRLSEITEECVTLGEPAVRVLLPALDDSKENIRESVAYILSEMGPRAQSAVPHLIQRISDASDLNQQLLLVHILDDIGGSAVGALQEFAARGSKREKLLGAIALAQIDHNLMDNEFTQLYLDSLSSSDRNLRLLAAILVSTPGLEASDTAPLLIPLLNEPDAEIQSMASDALEAIGPPAIPHLIKALENGNQAFQIRVAQTLTHIDPTAAADQTLDILIDMLQDELHPYQSDIFYIMAQMGPAAQKAAPHLLNMVKNSERDVKFEAFNALQAIKPNDNQSLGELLDMLHRPDPEIRLMASQVLRTFEFTEQQKKNTLSLLLTDSELQKYPRDVVTALRPVMINTNDIISLFQDFFYDFNVGISRDPPLGAGYWGTGYPPPAGLAYPVYGGGYPPVGAGYAVSSVDIGQLNPTLAAPILIFIRHCATLSLAQIAPEMIHEDLLQSLIDDLEHENAAPTAAYVLGEIGPAAHQATETLKKLLPSYEQNVQIAFAWALIKIAPETEQQNALDIIETALDHSDPYIRQKVIFALRDIGAVNDQVINTLIRAIENEDLEIQLLAISALTQFGSAAQSAVPFLERIADNPNHALSFVADEALKKIKKHP